MTPDSGWTLTFSRTLPRRGRVTLVALVALLLAGMLPAAAAATDTSEKDGYSLYETTLAMGVQEWWKAGYTGAGIDVAVIDTGAVRVEGLDAPGKVIYGPDLSLESQESNLRNKDTYGHGTVMAGLIAGRDSDASAPYEESAKTSYVGVAPDARIVSIKVATADGGADVSQVIAAINWVIQHRNDDGLNIRVLSLSYGTNGKQSPVEDPLVYAAEQAWKAGIVVVAATGNTGFQRGANAPGVATPATSPLLIAVGASDTQGTITLADDKVASFSASGCGAGCRRPDLVAPGTNIQGLRVPNSYLDDKYPKARRDDRFFRGSGTSQATALVAGAAALVLDKHPRYSPDRVKQLLRSNAFWLSSGKKGPAAQGRGEIDMAATLWSTVRPAFSQPPSGATGMGSLDRSRGTSRLSMDKVVLEGEIDIFGRPFDAAAIAAASANRSSWSGGEWNGSSWSGSSWSGSSWSGSSWSGSSWSGSSWSGSSWSGSSWSSSSWSGSSWSGSSWSSQVWATAGWD